MSERMVAHFCFRVCADVGFLLVRVGGPERKRSGSALAHEDLAGEQDLHSGAP